MKLTQNTVVLEIGVGKRKTYLNRVSFFSFKWSLCSFGRSPDLRDLFVSLFSPSVTVNSC